MNSVLGIDGKIWRNVASYGSPTWTLVDNVKNLRLPLKRTESDLTRRASGKNRELAAVLMEAELNFEMVHDRTDPNYVAIRAAFIARTALDLAIADGPMDAEGTEYFRALFAILDFSRNEELENVMDRTVVMKPTCGDHEALYAVVSEEWNEDSLLTEDGDALETEDGELLLLE